MGNLDTTCKYKSNCKLDALGQGWSVGSARDLVLIALRNAYMSNQAFNLVFL